MISTLTLSYTISSPHYPTRFPLTRNPQSSTIPTRTLHQKNKSMHKGSIHFDSSIQATHTFPPLNNTREEIDSTSINQSFPLTTDCRQSKKPYHITSPVYCSPTGCRPHHPKEAIFFQNASRIILKHNPSPSWKPWPRPKLRSCPWYQDSPQKCK